MAKMSDFVERRGPLLAPSITQWYELRFGKAGGRMNTGCKDTLEVERIGILYCQREDGHDNGHTHFTDGLVDAEWQRNPLKARVDRLMNKGHLQRLKEYQSGD